MSRNLDVATLRSFLTVAELGGVTRAAAQLNLIQSAVSLQIKRLEAVFGQPLFDRSGRGVTLTSRGEQLVGPAWQLLEINDETLLRMTLVASAGEIALGVPDDLLHPHVPKVMRAFAEAHPWTKVRLHSGQSATLKEQFVRGALDLILTSEPELEPGGEGIASAPLVWVGAPGGRAWRRRPLPLGTVAGCRFAKPAIESLNVAGFDWRLEVLRVRRRTWARLLSAVQGAAVLPASRATLALTSWRRTIRPAQIDRDRFDGGGGKRRSASSS